MELWQRGVIDAGHTGGLDLSWGSYETIEKLLFMTAKREGFSDTIADSAGAQERRPGAPGTHHCRRLKSGVPLPPGADKDSLHSFGL